ncbi:hypothetical protein BMF94_0471 [Rhodotorula taiwanensis]|uniref:MICOS complex subunit MIC10 n=1 Tax=Rhodotorula taiwanensis TaxID=741276 RepID=A0A2S5BHM7_9BASI|nr:hypothetical protein BMF94_0471 [Rhodotorula taiwanensis]
MSAPATPSSPQQVRSEDILSAKTDLCLSNALVKAGTGLAVGIVTSAILFRRRPWPVFLGLGFGIGQGYADCERVFNPAAVPGFKVQGQEKASPFQLSSPFAAVSPSQSSAVRPGPQVPASTPAAGTTTNSVVQQAKGAFDQAKSKAAAVAHKAQDKAEEVKDKVVGAASHAEKKAEQKVDELKGDKKWV